MAQVVRQALPEADISALPGRLYVETDGAGRVLRVEPVDSARGVAYYSARGGNVGRIYEPQPRPSGRPAFRDVTTRALGEVAGGGGAVGDLIDGIKIVDSKVGGKIPVDEFRAIRQSSIKNPKAKTLTLGKFTPTVENGVEDWSRPGPDSYIARAGKDSSYFDLGNNWSAIKQKYGLTNNEMFDYFNKVALDDSISSGKTIRFSHNPLDYSGSFLASEWEHLKEILNLADSNLIFEGDFWYVR